SLPVEYRQTREDDERHRDGQDERELRSRIHLAVVRRDGAGGGIEEGELLAGRRQAQVPADVLQNGPRSQPDHLQKRWKRLAKVGLHEILALRPVIPLPIRMTLLVAKRIDLAHVDHMLLTHEEPQARKLSNGTGLDEPTSEGYDDQGYG